MQGLCSIVTEEEAKGRTNSTTQQSGSPSLLPHMTDGFDEVARPGVTSSLDRKATILMQTTASYVAKIAIYSYSTVILIRTVIFMEKEYIINKNNRYNICVLLILTIVLIRLLFWPGGTGSCINSCGSVVVVEVERSSSSSSNNNNNSADSIAAPKGS